MADDSMFLNFVVDENIAPVKNNTQKFQGGSWTQRLKAKRIANWADKPRDIKTQSVNQVPVDQKRYQNRQQNAAKEVADEFPNPRPTKRRRENRDLPRSQSLATEYQKQERGPREVVSSIFTYNPAPSSTVDPPTANVEEKPTAPSNAPLPDGIDTFTSLGLSSTIAAHLLTKMNLKNPTAIQKAAVSQMLRDESDAFIQSETGSGKTLAYLLPLVHRIMTMSETFQQQHKDYTEDTLKLHRDSGLFAIILAPTRELCKQISIVLDRLLGCARYIVAGHVLGGEKKKSEKARLRKGLNVLVATPGRLVDHLENTKVLDVSNVRWLVLDEGDRLMELGFEEDIGKIVKMLDQKKRPKGSSRNYPGLPERRTTVLCSATLKMGVQRLGEISLKDANLIKGEGTDTTGAEVGKGDGPTESTFLAPTQLKQNYIICAAKLRFVTLTALLKRTFARKGSVMKAVVFMSCADSVDFHFKALTAKLDEGNEATENKQSQSADDCANSDAEDLQTNPTNIPKFTSSKPTLDLADAISPSPYLSSTENPLTAHKLHGSLPQSTRTAIITAFTRSTGSSLLLATDVASRGLDLPNLDLVIEYDPAFSADDHLHRIGRTARLGRDGRAVVFLLPGKEEGYVDILKSSFKQNIEEGVGSHVTAMAGDDVLRKGFTPTSGVLPTAKSSQQPKESWSTAAESYQLRLERHILANPNMMALARKAFQAHIRAYATHTSSERKYFDIRELHLGHLCKAFGLRETPTGIGAGRGMGASKRKRPTSSSNRNGGGKAGGGDAAEEGAGVIDVDENARKMREKVRVSRKLMLGGGGAEEFNIA
jgi:ATP-dependent RNA helicase DDX31/DBP7